VRVSNNSLAMAASVTAPGIVWQRRPDLSMQSRMHWQAGDFDAYAGVVADGHRPPALPPRWPSLAAARSLPGPGRRAVGATGGIVQQAWWLASRCSQVMYPVGAGDQRGPLLAQRSGRQLGRRLRRLRFRRLVT
jgi:hypothetical protein